MYRELKYGLLEQLYAAALTLELRDRGHTVVRELRVPVEYKGHQIGWQRLDIVVDHRLILEVKATEILPPNARRQLLSYLSATQLELGLVLHFGPKPHFYRQINSNDPR